MQDNPELQLAWKFIEQTGTHIFLTGKAGTGKTTFLRRLKEHSPKRMVVLAPTGIAAINAGGVTIHSFFQLPFAPYIPDSSYASAEHAHRFGKEKINIIRSMDLLVIDEISMVRADLLDAIDDVLRKYRGGNKPFGGVQLLMIGDLQQLAPVIKEEEQRMLSSYYPTFFFFGSKALQQSTYLTIELQHVYRQSDQYFLNLLNRIRTNEADESVLSALNQRCIPDFQPETEGKDYIRLVTHNHQAQQYNESKLSQLTGRSFRFRCTTQGNFPESMYPADETLIIKEGAQIMFLKNDTNNEKRYYNGKLGKVTAVSEDAIHVRGEGDDHSFTIEPEEWTNAKYSLNKETNEITEEVEGVFKQYPIRLAWAITIHKSQGLTFERAIIDAAASFAHGQVYVALSRCKTLEGMVLDTPIRRSAIISDQQVSRFNQHLESTESAVDQFTSLQRKYFYELVSEQFNFSEIAFKLKSFCRIIDEYLYKLYPQYLEKLKQSELVYKTKISKVSDSFRNQYTHLCQQAVSLQTDHELQERMMKGATYFSKELNTTLSLILSEAGIEIDNKEIKKRYIKALDELKELYTVKLETLRKTAQEGFDVSGYLQAKAQALLQQTEKTPAARSRKTKTPTVNKMEVPDDIMRPDLYKTLIEWRREKAAEAGIPAYCVVNQKALIGFTNLLPENKDELIKIPYFGKRGAEKYGQEILEILTQYDINH